MNAVSGVGTNTGTNTGTCRLPDRGWPALLADIRGEGPSVTSAIVAVLVTPPEQLGGWCAAALDEAWCLACEQEQPAAPTTR